MVKDKEDGKVIEFCVPADFNKWLPMEICLMIDKDTGETTAVDILRLDEASEAKHRRQQLGALREYSSDCDVLHLKPSTDKPGDKIRFAHAMRKNPFVVTVPAKFDFAKSALDIDLGMLRMEMLDKCVIPRKLKPAEKKEFEALAQLPRTLATDPLECHDSKVVQSLPGTSAQRALLRMSHSKS